MFGGDCDDDDISRSPETLRYRDRDGDSFGDETQSIQNCEPVEGYALEPGDCDDADSTRNPNSQWYQDLNGDGFGGATMALSCEDLPGYVRTAGDCNDDATDIYPGAPVQCERIDANCDGIVDLVDSDVAMGWLAVKVIVVTMTLRFYQAQMRSVMPLTMTAMASLTILIVWPRLQLRQLIMKMLTKMVMAQVVASASAAVLHLVLS